MKESELHQSSGIALSIINPNNGTHVVMNVPPGQRKGQLLLRGPFGERWIYLSLGVDPEAPGDEDLWVTLTTANGICRGGLSLPEAPSAPLVDALEEFTAPKDPLTAMLNDVLADPNAKPTGSTVMSLTPTGGFKIEGEVAVEISSGDPPPAAPEIGPTGGPYVEGPQKLDVAGVVLGETPPPDAPARPQAPKSKKAGG